MTKRRYNFPKASNKTVSIRIRYLISVYYRVTGFSLFFSNLISWVLVNYLSWILIAQNFLDKWTFDNLLGKSWIFEETNNGNKISFTVKALFLHIYCISYREMFGILLQNMLYLICS